MPALPGHFGSMQEKEGIRHDETPTLSVAISAPMPSQLAGSRPSPGRSTKIHMDPGLPAENLN